MYLFVHPEDAARKIENGLLSVENLEERPTFEEIVEEIERERGLKDDAGNDILLDEWIIKLMIKGNFRQDSTDERDGKGLNAIRFQTNQRDGDRYPEGGKT